MNVIERLNRELAYNAWANREALRSLLVAQTVPERATVVMGHIIGAEGLWLKRMGQNVPPMEVWPELPRMECEGQLRELSRAWQIYVGGLRPELLEQQICYTNSKG